jgi:hypothetical protein
MNESFLRRSRSSPRWDAPLIRAEYSMPEVTPARTRTLPREDGGRRVDARVAGHAA